MKYEEIKDGMREHGAEPTPSGFAAILTAEFLLLLAALLALLAFIKMFSSLLAVIIAIPLAWFSLRIYYSKTAFRENDDRFDTLLFYMLLTLVSVIILVGWQP